MEVLEEEEKAERGFLRKSVVLFTIEGFSSCKISSSLIGSSIPKPFLLSSVFPCLIPYP